MSKPISSQNLLEEAFRRFECFAVERYGAKWNKKDVMYAWTGLMYPSQAKRVIQDGYMKPVHSEHKRCLAWYQLTEKGANVILDWHKRGVYCEDYGTPSNCPNLTKE